jgi:membrane fusion protein
MGVTSGGEAPPFLELEPAPWATRGLAYLLIALFVIGATAAVVVRVPERVSGTFVLVPVRGTDPLRAAREGVIAEVRATEGSSVATGTPLFVIRSEPVGDRSATLRTLETQIAGSGAALANAERQYASGRSADEAELHRLESRLAYLSRAIASKGKQRALADDVATKLHTGYARGVVSGTEYTIQQLAAEQLGADVASAESDQADTRQMLVKLRSEMEARRVQYVELARQLAASTEAVRIQAAALGADTANRSGGLLAVRAPCAGTVLQLRVRSPGAVVQAGETLGEIACARAPLQADLQITQEGLALVRPGQGVKLMYDAFPYQRFGARGGTVRWVGPASANRDSTSFRALVDIDTAPVIVHGVARSLVAGMGGRGDVIVGRRAVVGYIFEPIRQLRENFTEAPHP